MQAEGDIGGYLRHPKRYHTPIYRRNRTEYDLSAGQMAADPFAQDVVLAQQGLLAGAHALFFVVQVVILFARQAEEGLAKVRALVFVVGFGQAAQGVAIERFLWMGHKDAFMAGIYERVSDRVTPHTALYNAIHPATTAGPAFCQCA